MKSSAYSFEFLLKLGVALALLPSVMANPTANPTCSNRSIVLDNLHDSGPLSNIEVLAKDLMLRQGLLDIIYISLDATLLGGGCLVNSLNCS